MRKLFLLVFIVFTFFIIPAFQWLGNSPAYAYVDDGFADAIDAALNPATSDMNSGGSTAEYNTNNFSDFARRAIGDIPGVTTNSKDKAYLQEMRQKSFVYGADTVLSQLYTNPPASTYAFIIDTGMSLGFIPKKAYAQGIGFGGLSPLLPLWKAFRNIAYLIVAIFMIMVGFLIMFRKKIDPKTVITVQNALPNIIVTLLLITFSYAIVGILIDFMYLVIMLAFSILQPISQGAIAKDQLQIFIAGNFWDTSKFLMGKSADATINGIVQMMGPWAVGTEAATTTVGLLSSLFTGGPGVLVGMGLPPLLLIVIVCLALIIAIIRLFFLLISAYIQVIISLLTAPFQLLMGAFPGSHAFDGWIKNLISNLAVFPITAVLLLIGAILVKFDSGATKLWGPPMLNPTGNNGMAAIIGLGVLFAIPSVAGSLKEILKSKPMINAGPSTIIGPVGGAVGQTLQYATQISMLRGVGANIFPQKDKKAS